MQFRATVLAMPAALVLAAAAAVADPLTLTPLGPAHRETVAAFGATCAVPYAPARVSETYVLYPTISREVGAEGVSTVGISLLPNGHVARAWSIKPSGNAMLDRAALDSALGSRYVAERSQCAPVGGEYKVEVDFSLDQ
jgi:TonB family protein